jgi:hypothetical protein
VAHRGNGSGDRALSRGGAMVREVEILAAARTLTTLPRLDYTDAFLVQTGPGNDRTGEQWARIFLEGAPAATRKALRSGWAALGLQLGAADAEDRVLGWELRHNDADHALLAGDSRVGFSAELLLRPEGDTLLFATLLQLKNPAAQALWATIALGHRKVVKHVLEQGARRELG